MSNWSKKIEYLEEWFRECARKPPSIYDEKSKRRIKDMGNKMPTFGDVIWRKRKVLGMTQASVVQKIMKRDGLPISESYLSDLENNKRAAPNINMMKQFADKLDIPLDYLCYLKGILPPDIRDSIKMKYIVNAFAAFRNVLDDAPEEVSVIREPEIVTAIVARGHIPDGDKRLYYDEVTEYLQKLGFDVCEGDDRVYAADGKYLIEFYYEPPWSSRDHSRFDICEENCPNKKVDIEVLRSRYNDWSEK